MYSRATWSISLLSCVIITCLCLCSLRHDSTGSPRRYWEIFNTIRRLTLTSFVLGCPTLAISTIFTMAVSITTLVIEREAEPYVDSSLSAFCYVMHWQVMTAVRQGCVGTLSVRLRACA